MFVLEVDSFARWRQQARELLKRAVVPEQIAWRQAGQAVLDFGAGAGDFLSLPVRDASPKVPQRFLALAEEVACFDDERRWSMLYRLAWRLVFEDRRLLDLKVDDQVACLYRMQKSVARDKHKMKAFVRFQRLETELGSGEHAAHFIAWFEPQHLILPALAPFFVKRFTTMRWSILTPRACAHWDLQQLTLTAGAQRRRDTGDDIEQLWLQYYKSIFNPARLKLKAMQAEMPKKYWRNLPEAPLIGELQRDAQRRVDKMLDDGYSQTPGKAVQSQYLRAQQQRLRNR
ncbi:DNA metabolism protein [Exilibacterium tricleocarpae]|uniref:DNA metabolism protein n=1 Tax=Exilibacterium tricleocarpae TaxID=2591008 RepID=A0A545SYS5_9GAMM|nr:TIGR03915 family putative DNA repair protein [Exilibacterium tricleocarpae]TQV70120.1 DNA metabolism protein [Exilibacterium tricleocarpae]